MALSIPEQQEGMVAPGQEELLEQFIAEQTGEDGQGGQGGQGGEDSEGELLAGKYKTPQELERAYKELERKLGQRKAGGGGDGDGDDDGGEDDGEDDGEEPIDPASYTREKGVELYGEQLADLFDRAKLNPFGIQQQIEQGELSLDQAAEKMAEALPFPVSFLRTYLGGIYAEVEDGEGGGESVPPQGLTADEVAEVQAVAGGPEQFTRLAAWAKENLDKSMLQAYNAAVTGTKEQASWAVAGLMAMQAAQTQTPVKEPRLIRGRTGPATAKFESEAQVLEAMNKTNNKGQRLYDVDPSYREKVARLLAVSDVF